MGSGALDGRRILLVEDHAGTASALTWLLGRQGYAVNASRSLADATVLAASQTYDLILCDIGLPDGSGCDLMATLRQQGASTRGIVMSGFTDDATVAAARAAGFARFLAKPVTFPDVLKAIEEVLTAAPDGVSIRVTEAPTGPPLVLARF